MKLGQAVSPSPMGVADEAASSQQIGRKLEEGVTRLFGSTPAPQPEGVQPDEPAVEALRQYGETMAQICLGVEPATLACDSASGPSGGEDAAPGPKESTGALNGLGRLLRCCFGEAKAPLRHG